MTQERAIVVREVQIEDLPLIADYWLKSSDAFLIGMGVDLAKVPKRGDLLEMLKAPINEDYPNKSSLAMIIEVNGTPSGHCNVNSIKYGEEASMHLHLWQTTLRQKGLGSMMVLKSVKHFFKHLKLKRIICEPYALNPAPNKTLQKLGFSFEKKRRCIPGTLNFEQEVNRYSLTKAQFDAWEEA